jgi:hypothetical protein
MKHGRMGCSPVKLTAIKQFYFVPRFLIEVVFLLMSSSAQAKSFELFICVFFLGKSEHKFAMFKLISTGVLVAIFFSNRHLHKLIYILQCDCLRV